MEASINSKMWQKIHFSTTIPQIHIAAHNFVSITILINNIHPERKINMKHI
jgi:hypothetical protein